MSSVLSKFVYGIDVGTRRTEAIFGPLRYAPGVFMGGHLWVTMFMGGTAIVGCWLWALGAVKRFFGEHARRVAVSSTKSMTGHLLGGAGGLEAGVTVLAIRDQIAPPTINYEVPDPECDIDVVPNQARPMEINCALSNSFGFGGTNACLAFTRYDR